jgi:hypothetical protein
MVGQKMDVIFIMHGLMEAEAEIARRRSNPKLAAVGDRYVHCNIAMVIQRAGGFPPDMKFRMKPRWREKPISEGVRQRAQVAQIIVSAPSPNKKMPGFLARQV